MDNFENPNVWDAPRLIIQIDSLLNLVYKCTDVISGEAFHLDYDLIVLDESESLLCHFDEKTMENKEIDIWSFFDEISQHSKKLVLMDGDMSERSLGFASSYGSMVYVNNKNNETNTALISFVIARSGSKVCTRTSRLSDSRTPYSGFVS